MVVCKNCRNKINLSELIRYAQFDNHSNLIQVVYLLVIYSEVRVSN